MPRVLALTGTGVEARGGGCQRLMLTWPTGMPRHWHSCEDPVSKLPQASTVTPSTAGSALLQQGRGENGSERHNENGNLTDGESRASAATPSTAGSAPPQQRRGGVLEAN
ncbi:hypothetical protein ABPG75_005720 [Micractinium tetrahymenae]